jgi:hypothetical protein
VIAGRKNSTIFADELLKHMRQKFISVPWQSEWKPVFVGAGFTRRTAPLTLGVA